MKKSLLIIFCLISLNGFGQTRYEKVYFQTKIPGLIEIDGHVFNNDTCSAPIYFIATFEKNTFIELVSHKKYYFKRCDKIGCEITHLTEIRLEKIKANYDEKTGLYYIIH